MFTLLLLLLATSFELKGHHQANIYRKKLKMLMHIVKNVSFMGSHLYSLELQLLLLLLLLL